jgi:type IV pilus assembly protein PilM
LQNRILISSVTPRKRSDVGTWFKDLSTYGKDRMADAERKTPPSGEGYIVTLVGTHYHDETFGKELRAGGDLHHNRTLYGEGYLSENFLKKLQQWEVSAHDNSGQVKVGGIGISHATIADCPPAKPEMLDPLGETLTPQLASRGGPGQWGGRDNGMGGTMKLSQKRIDKGRGSGGMTNALDALELGDDKGGTSTKGKLQSINRTDFIIEFVWTPNKPLPKPASPAGALASSGTTAPGAAGASSAAPGRPPASTAAFNK